MPVVIKHFIDNDQDVEISFKVDRIVFPIGGEINFKKDGIIIVTGPNNSGKSQFLREISQRITNRNAPSHKRYAISKIMNFDFYGTCSELCEIAAKSTLSKGNENWFLQLKHQNLQLSGLLNQVQQQPQLSEAVLRALLTYLPTNSRLQELRTSPIQYFGSNFGVGVQPPVLRRIHEDRRIEQKLNKFTEDLFGLSFAINRYAFHDSRPHLLENNVPLTIDMESDAIARWFEEQPLLDEQGDGVNAFCGILATILADPRPLVVIDEPELFLHPPQIRQLAKIMATETPANTQMFVATHSDEFVRGMIEFGADRVSVMRITRNPKKYLGNTVKTIDSSRIEDLWKDPLLKTSDALSSLFYNTAVIVEGDSDARFFRSMFDALEDKKNPVTDVRFFHCGGKDRIYRIASAFRAIGITTVTIVDIDILDDRAKFARLVESFGGQMDLFIADLTLINKHVLEKKSLENTGLARHKLLEILDKLDSKRPLPKKAIDSCLEVLKTASPWTPLKTAGVEALEAGEPSLAMDRIISNAKSIGIIINHHGELESLWKYTSGSKSQWTSAALERNLRTDPKMKKARDFTREIIGTISIQNSAQS